MPVPDENGNPYFDVVFGSSGNLTPVPDAIQANGSVSFIQGWGPFYSQDPTVNPATALFIDRAQTNQLFNYVTQALQAYQQFGTPAFITSAMNGGSPFSYAKNARTEHLGIVYQSLVDTNTTTPPSASWAPVTNGSAGGVQGEAKNLKGVWNTNTTATFTADQIALQDSSNSGFLLLAFNKTLNLATSGAGGLDTGSLANNTWYNVFAIYNPTTSTPNILFSLSATAPTLPAGYTLFARIGTIRIDGSAHMIGFIQYGPDTQFVVGQNLAAMRLMTSGSAGSISNTATTFVAVAIGAFVPSTAGLIKIASSLPGTASTTETQIAPNPNFAGYDVTLGATVPPINHTMGTAFYNQYLEDMLLESSSIYYASSVPTAAIFCVGYRDNF